MKRILSLLLIFCMVFSFQISSSASNPISVTIDGTPIHFDVQPTIIDGRTMVPLRAIFEALGATVEWDGDTQTVTSFKTDTIIQLTIGDANLYVNDEAKVLDVPAQILDSRTLVPARAISEAFGYDVEWWSAYKTVSIVTDHDVMYKKFVDFVKTKGSIGTDGTYGIQTDIPYHSGDSGESYGTITLVYDPADMELQLQVLEYFLHNDNDTTILFLTVDLPKKADNYDWQFQYMIDRPSYSRYDDYFMAAEGILKANVESYLDDSSVSTTNIILGSEITTGSAASNVGIQMIMVPIYGNNMFSDNGSALRLDYFGLN